MNTIKATAAYTLATFVSVTAYEVYQGCLSDYNFGFALVGFQTIMLLVLYYVYPSVELGILSKLNVTENTAAISMREAFKRQLIPLICLGITSCIKYSLMLPFLTNLHNSLLFIIFFSLSGLAKVPFAVLIFKDNIANPKTYWIGLLIATLGGIAYSINPIYPQVIFNADESVLLFMALLKVPFEIFDSIYSRYITTPKMVKEKVVTVKVLEQVKAIFTIVFGLIVGIWAYTQNADMSIIPDLKQASGILWIGVVVTISATLAVRLMVEITHTISQPVQSIRPLLGFAPLVVVYLTHGGNTIELLYKFICILFVLLGVALCMLYGNPIFKKRI